MGENKQTEVKKKKPVKKKKRKFFKILYILLLLIILSTVAVGSGIFLAVIKTAPKLEVNNFLKVRETSILYDNSGLH